MIARPPFVVPALFDRRFVRLRRDRAAKASLPPLWEEAGTRLLERLDDIRRSFTAALDLGCRDGQVSRGLARRGIPVRAAVDLSPRLAAQTRLQGFPAVSADEERLPFAPGSFDLVVGCLSLHWTNDLPGVLAQLRTVLRPDGLLLVSLPGLGTLDRLRAVLTEAELAQRGGASPRVSPFVTLSDLAGLLQRAGFALPVADLDRITVRYRSALELLQDLQGLGEVNALVERDRRPLPRSVLAEALARYGDPTASPDGRIAAEFVLLTATGWAPSADQPRPLQPGSGRTPLAEALGAIPPRGGGNG